jgi:enoyl-CoA hydratase/carnithine racemase
MKAVVDGSIGWMIFDNPKRLNALSLDMWQGIADIVSEFEQNDDVRVIVLKGAGEKAFISGADISQFSSERSSGDRVANYGKIAGRANTAVQGASKPTIAMIRGYCLGGGLGMALNCDLRLASSDSCFSIPAAKLGVGYDHRGLGRLMDLVGPAFAKEIFFVARQFDASEAAAMGLVNRVVEPPELEDLVRNYCRRIAANAPLTIRAVKTIVGELCKDESARDLELCRAVVRDCFESDDYVEGQAAFMEKRRPKFRGR